MDNSLCIAFYNVENLFDIYDNKRKADDDFLAYSPKRWNKDRYELKLSKIAKVLSEIGKEETGKAPIVIGLAEVENDKVLKDLIKQKEILPFNYRFSHYESQDERGIDVAFLYQEKYVDLLSSKTYTVPLFTQEGKKDYSRDILYCKTKIKNEIIHFFTIHLPSKRDNDINLFNRIKIIQKVRELSDELYDKYGNPNIIIFGDFNENPNVESLRKELNTTPNPDYIKDNQLYNPFELLLEQKKYSLFYKHQGNLFDQLILSKNLLENPAFEYHYSKVFSPYYLQEFSHKYLGQPFRTYAGTRYLGGYSDHFPIYSIFKVQN
ncbi:MAG: endonuclease [Flavobacteriales bacterium]|nr:endonuclease [Flavobacteriales bacterium]